MKLTAKHLVMISAMAVTGFGVAPAFSVDAPEKADKEKYEQKKESAKEKKEARQPRQRGGHSKGNFMDTYDLDSNGQVSVEEFYQGRNKGYDIRDTDGDGNVLSDEYVAEYEARLDKQLAEQRDRQLKQAYVRFGVLDGDKNGVMTREEFKTSGKRMFDRLDTNKDGIVDDKDDAKRY